MELTCRGTVHQKIKSWFLLFGPFVLESAKSNQVNCLYLVSDAKGNIAKSNKSDLWNRLSYRILPYLLKVRNQTFRNNFKISKWQPQNSTLIVIRLQQPRKAQMRIFFKMSWNNSISPIDAKNNITFFVQFFWVSLDF